MVAFANLNVSYQIIHLIEIELHWDICKSYTNLNNEYEGILKYKTQNATSPNIVFLIEVGLYTGWYFIDVKGWASKVICIICWTVSRWMVAWWWRIMNRNAGCYFTCRGTGIGGRKSINLTVPFGRNSSLFKCIHAIMVQIRWIHAVG